MPTKPIDVIYIAGAGRSGSTLLELLLLQEIPNTVTVGELRQIWGAGLMLNRLCDCGKQFSDCEFWRTVVDRFLGDVDDSGRAGLVAMSRSQIKNRNIPRDLFGFDTIKNTEFTYALERLYLAIRSETNADWIIDSSKLPAYALRLSSSPNLRIHLIHVVRDSRATAFSWARNKPSSRRKLKNRAPSQAARLWVTHNLLTLVVRRKSSSYMRLRYEDLASEPILSLASITKHLSALVDRTQDEVYPTRSRSISHALMGNPMRHGLKPLDVQLDEEWRDRLRFFDGALVTFLTWPLLILFRYPLRWRR